MIMKFKLKKPFVITSNQLKKLDKNLDTLEKIIHASLILVIISLFYSVFSTAISIFHPIINYLLFFTIFFFINKYLVKNSKKGIYGFIISRTDQYLFAILIIIFIGYIINFFDPSLLNYVQESDNNFDSQIEEILLSIIVFCAEILWLSYFVLLILRVIINLYLKVKERYFDT